MVTTHNTIEIKIKTIIFITTKSVIMMNSDNDSKDDR